MTVDRRAFLAGLVGGVAGLLVPDRRVWALDGSMIRPVARFDASNPTWSAATFGGKTVYIDCWEEDTSVIETGWFDASMPPLVKVFDPEQIKLYWAMSRVLAPKASYRDWADSIGG